MFRHTSKDGRITVYETSSDFQVTLNATGETRGMGDGVDRYTDNSGDSVMVGTPDFYELLKDEADYETQELIDAYFAAYEGLL